MTQEIHHAIASIHQRLRRLSIEELRAVDDHVTELEQFGVLVQEQASGLVGMVEEFLEEEETGEWDRPCSVMGVAP